MGSASAAYRLKAMRAIASAPLILIKRLESAPDKMSLYFLVRRIHAIIKGIA
jgi:hypothetical protein